MSIDLQLGLDHDLLISNFDLNLVSNVDQIMQHINIRLRFYFGEWFLDISKGLPYYTDVLKKDFDVGVVESAFKAQIVGTPGVTSLTKFDLVIDTKRKLQVTFKVIVLDEEIEGEVIL